jgi:hypothetical protein
LTLGLPDTCAGGNGYFLTHTTEGYCKCCTTADASTNLRTADLWIMNKASTTFDNGDTTNYTEHAGNCRRESDVGFDDTLRTYTHSDLVDKAECKWNCSKDDTCTAFDFTAGYGCTHWKEDAASPYVGDSIIYAPRTRDYTHLVGGCRRSSDG